MIFVLLFISCVWVSILYDRVSFFVTMLDPRICLSPIEIKTNFIFPVNSKKKDFRKIYDVLRRSPPYSYGFLKYYSKYGPIEIEMCTGDIVFLPMAPCMDMIKK